jgi:hypothetical protein
MFVVISIIYRPIEQLLSRTIADRRARGHREHPYRVPSPIQASFAVLFAAVALALKEPIENDVFDGSSTLYWVLVIGTLAYAAVVLRAWLARRARALRALRRARVPRSDLALPVRVAAAIGITSGQDAVAVGIAAAPFVSLVVVPWAFSRRRGDEDRDSIRRRKSRGCGDLHGATGWVFTFSVLGIMLAEQTLLNAAVITTDITATDAALAGFVFNVLLIARAPLQLFQSIQTSLLPHLTGLEAREGRRRLPPHDPPHDLAHRRLRRRGRARAPGHRAVGDGRALRRQLPLRAGRAGDRRAGHGAAPDGRRAQPGGARPPPGQARGLRLAVQRGAVLAFVLAPTISNQVLRVEVAYFGPRASSAGCSSPCTARRSETPQVAPAAAASSR